MELATFGCSFTSGVETLENENSWPRELAKLLPKYKIKNYAWAGSSLLWSVAQLKKYKEVNPTGITVFQITTPFRYTIYKQAQFNKIIKPTGISNYFDVDHEYLSKFIKIYTPNTDIKNSPHRDFISEYYNHINVEMELIAFNALLDYVKNNATFYFSHRHYNDDIISIERVFGKKFPVYVGDNGFHFKTKGLIKQAEYVLNVLNL